MVVFTCSHCGDSVKKTAVSKHYGTVCRNKRIFLTCVDCLKDFLENEYESHTKCITEEERYSAKGFVPKPSSNKGEKKQEMWTNCVQELFKTGNLTESERKLVQDLTQLNNIPRKRNKFKNFLSSTCKMYARNPSLVDQVFDKIEKLYEEKSSGSKNEENGSQMANDETPNVSVKEEETVNGQPSGNSPGKKNNKKLNWTDCFKEILKTENLEEDERELLEDIALFENFPRKKVKFMNFLKTNFPAYAEKTDLIDKLWKTLENFYFQSNSVQQEVSQENCNPNDTKNGAQNNEVQDCNNSPHTKEGNNSKVKENGNANINNLEVKHSRVVEKMEIASSEKDDLGSGKGKKRKSDFVDIEEAGNPEENKREKKKKKKTEANENQKSEMNGVIFKMEKENGDVNTGEGKKIKKSKKHSVAPDEARAQVSDSEIRLNEGNKTGENFEEKSPKGKKEKVKPHAKKVETAEQIQEQETRKKNSKENGKVKKRKIEDLENSTNGLQTEHSNQLVEGSTNDCDINDVELKIFHRSFPWIDTILDVLSQNEIGEKVTLNQLKKTVFKYYYKCIQTEMERLAEKKFLKVLDKIDNVKIDGNYVTLKR